MSLILRFGVPSVVLISGSFAAKPLSLLSEVHGIESVCRFLAYNQRSSDQEELEYESNRQDV